MTEPERQMEALAAQLQDERCHCGAVPDAIWDGAMCIRCGQCGIQIVTPDWDPAGAFREWVQKLSSQTP